MEKFTNKKQLLEYLKENNLFGLDSEYSKNSVNIANKFSAKGLDMNIWWVRTSINWECPSCNRNKQDIVRLNKHGYLTAHLHEHHDHMKDHIKQKFTIFSEKAKNQVADKYAEKFIIRTAFAFSAYDNTIICSDCNSADGRVKKLIPIHKKFSYSPKQIGLFVESRPNKEHSINIGTAKKIWQECKDMFYKRIEIAEYIAKLAASDNHWYESSLRTSKISKKSAKWHLAKQGLTNLVNHNNPECLLYTTNKFTGNNSSWRLYPKVKSIAPPSMGEFEHMKKMGKSDWDKLDEDWICPTCNRTKYECIKKSNKGKWTVLRYLTEFCNHTSSIEDKRVYVCDDCSNVSKNIVNEVTDKLSINVINKSSFITQEELSKIIVPRPHNKHLIKNKLIDELLKVIEYRILSN